MPASPPKNRAISKRRAGELIGSSVADDELTSLLGDGEVAYRTPEGAALIGLSDGSFRLWYSRQQVLEYFLSVLGGPRVIHVLDKYDFDSDFPEQVDLSLSKCMSKLSLGATAGEWGQALELLQEVVRRRGASKLLARGVFEGVVACVGEELRSRRPGAEWRMVLDREANCWQPDLVVDDQVMPIGLELHDELAGNGRDAVLKVDVPCHRP